MPLADPDIEHNILLIKLINVAYITAIYSFERSEFLIATSKKKNLSVCVDVRLILVLVWKTLIFVLVWGTYYLVCASYVCTWYQPADHSSMVPSTYVQYRATSPPQKNTWYQRALRCQLRGRPFHPWAGRLRFSGEAHPGPATLTQSSSLRQAEASPRGVKAW